MLYMTTRPTILMYHRATCLFFIYDIGESSPTQAHEAPFVIVRKTISANDDQRSILYGSWTLV